MTELTWSGTDWQNASKTDVSVENGSFQLDTVIPYAPSQVQLTESNADDIHSGSYMSGDYLYADGNSRTTYFAKFTPYNEKVKLNSYTYQYYDSSNGHGGGMKIMNENGDRLMGTGTSNPNWEVVHGNGVEFGNGGGNYNDWHTVTVNFDWDSRTFDATFENESGETWNTYNLPLEADGYFDEIIVAAYDSSFGYDDAYQIDYRSMYVS